ncbi:MAG: rhomboid family intramembrane serine protease [Bacteroidota bacterium]|nr:rhomboid family intramembrane serine protease [Bacteroidota bacterium]
MDLHKELKYKFKQGNAVVQIILINVLVYLGFSLVSLFFFLFNQTNVLASFMKWLMLPAAFQNFMWQPWSIFSYMFLHEGFFHLLFNMLWLYWLGNLFQQYLGNTKTFQAYILGGVFGGLIYMLAYNIFPAFSNQVYSSFALGASAGVLSLVVAAATLLPEYSIQLLIIGQVRLKYIALFSVLLDLISIPNGNAGGHIAHVGGAAFGYLFIKLIYSQSNIPGALDSIFNGIGSWFKPKPNLHIHHKNKSAKATASNTKPNQQEIDAILDKISKKGYESLSQKEKEILFKASKG